MTDRHAGYVVTLAKDIREDDAEAIITALRMIKGVHSVEPVISDQWIEHIAHERAYDEVRTALFELLDRLRGSI
jgi:hypothetical protein